MKPILYHVLWVFSHKRKEFPTSPRKKFPIYSLAIKIFFFLSVLPKSVAIPHYSINNYMLYTICVLDRQQRIHKCGLLALIVRVRKTYLCVFYEFSRKLSLKRHEAETVIACLKKINKIGKTSKVFAVTTDKK